MQGLGDLVWEEVLDQAHDWSLAPKVLGYFFMYFMKIMMLFFHGRIRAFALLG